MGNAKTQQVIYTEIERQVKFLEDDRNLSSVTRASALKDLAAAYRLTYGGAQPGSSVIS